MRSVLIRFAVAGAIVASLAAGITPAVMAQSANLFVTVNSGGAIINSNGVTSVSHSGVGQYEATFVTDVSGCAYVATTNALSPSVSSSASLVFTAGGHASVNGVFVQTKNQNGALQDQGFDLFVDCDQFGTMFAVIGYSNNLVRSTPGTVLTPLGSGRYDIRFPVNVVACSFLATVGDPGNGTVSQANGVYTGTGGPGIKTVYIETKNLGGGLQAGIPFHVAVVCPGTASTQTAVVNSNGLMARGSLLTGSYEPSPGNYVLVTRTFITNCTTIATRGSVNRDVPFDPATVVVTPGPTATSTLSSNIGLQLRALQFFGGAPSSESFHAAVIC